MVCDEQTWQCNFYFPKTLRVGKSFECAQIHVLIRKLSSSKKESEPQCLVLTAPLAAGKIQLQWRGYEKAMRASNQIKSLRCRATLQSGATTDRLALLCSLEGFDAKTFCCQYQALFQKEGLEADRGPCPLLLQVPSGHAALFPDLRLFCLGRNSFFLPFLL